MQRSVIDESSDGAPGPLPTERGRGTFAHYEKESRRPARRGGDLRGHRARAHLHVPLAPAPGGAGGGRAARHGGGRAAPGRRAALQDHLLSGFEAVRLSWVRWLPALPANHVPEAPCRAEARESERLRPAVRVARV